MVISVLFLLWVRFLFHDDSPMINPFFVYQQKKKFNQPVIMPNIFLIECFYFRACLEKDEKIQMLVSHNVWNHPQQLAYSHAFLKHNLIIFLFIRQQLFSHREYCLLCREVLLLGQIIHVYENIQHKLGEWWDLDLPLIGRVVLIILYLLHVYIQYHHRQISHHHLV